MLVRAGACCKVWSEVVGQWPPGQEGAERICVHTETLIRSSRRKLRVGPTILDKSPCL